MDRLWSVALLKFFSLLEERFDFGHCLGFDFDLTYLEPDFTPVLGMEPGSDSRGDHAHGWTFEQLDYKPAEIYSRPERRVLNQFDLGGIGQLLGSEKLLELTKPLLEFRRTQARVIRGREER